MRLADGVLDLLYLSLSIEVYKIEELHHLVLCT